MEDWSEKLGKIKENFEKVDHALVQMLSYSVADALGAHIAIIDEKGIIVSVNTNWQAFAIKNDAVANYGIGTNYLEVCDNATGECSIEGKLAADGIRKVLAGELSYFDLEYPCHSPYEKRWYLMSIFPFKNHALSGQYYIITHENITRWVSKIHAVSDKLKEIQTMLALPPSPVE